MAGRERRPIAGKCIYVPLFAPFFLLQEWRILDGLRNRKTQKTGNDAESRVSIPFMEADAATLQG